MEPLTAITLLAGQYGIKQVVAALTGNQEVSALAGEIFRQLSASEDHLSSHLTHIEERLDQVLEQPYETAIGAGTRGLLDVVATRNSKARRKDLMQARERFRDATAAARSPLQRAVAERYLLLCAIALDRRDVAKTALVQLNYAATTAALEVDDTMRNADSIARSYLEERGEAKGFGKYRRLDARAGEIRDGANEAARVVANLLAEAGVVGQRLGQTQPPSISTPEQRSRVGAAAPTPATFAYSLAQFTARWRVVPNGPGPVRVGTFVVTWDRYELSGPAQRSPTVGTRLFPMYRYTSNVQVDVKIEADPPLKRSVPLKLGWGSVRQPATPKDVLRPYRSPLLGTQSHTLPAGGRLYHVKETVITSTDHEGKTTETPSVHIGPFVVQKPVREIITRLTIV